MEENPFAAPQTPVEPTPQFAEDDPQFLRAVANYQRGVLFCILLLIAAIFVGIAAGPEFRSPLVWGTRAVQLFGLVFVMLLATKLYRGALNGILLGLSVLIPIIGLLVLLMVNGKASRRLKKNGIHVGLLGARMSDLSS